VEKFGDDDGRNGVAGATGGALNHLRENSLELAFTVVAVVMVRFDVVNSSVVPVRYVFMSHDLVLALLESEKFLTLLGIRLRRMPASARDFLMFASSVENRNRIDTILDFVRAAAAFRVMASCNTIPRSVSALWAGL
jgi:hypothetical protein